MLDDGRRERLLRRLPAVEEVVKHLEPAGGQPGPAAAVGRANLVAAARRVIESLRRQILAGSFPAEEELAPAAVAGRAGELVSSWSQPRPRPVINATGVVLHTNLGRAVLPAAAREALAAAAGYCDLEIDLESGRRGSRQAAVEELLVELSGAETALVVNNNAAAVLLALNTLAAGREVIVSRGQLVEIGGSFRVPEVMAWSGARLREVGTTNKTYPEDYRQAAGPDTAALLRVHTSNFRVVGFTREVGASELAALGRELGLPVIEDLGSGLLLDLAEWGIRGEPLVPASLKAGVDVVTFSGDKLLGGPQAGIILGRSSCLERMSKNPLLRALRPDKLVLAALAATLRLYLDPVAARAQLPTLAMLTAPAEEIRVRAEGFRRALLAAIRYRAEGDGTLAAGRPELDLEIRPSVSEAGGGSLPGTSIPTWVIALRVAGLGAAALAADLRRGSIPVLARIEEEAVLLDLRTVAAAEEHLLLRALQAVLEKHC